MGWRSTAASAGAAGAVAAQREWDRRRRETLLGEQGLEPSEISGGRSLAMGVGVAVGATLIGRLESAIAGRATHAAARFLPGGETLWRPVGHAASLGVLLSGVRVAAQRVFRMIEGRQFAVEPAIDVPPLESEVSGGPGSLVEFRSLSKMGRRFVWTLRTPEIIEGVTGEPAVATPIRVYVGLNSAATEEARVALAITELERTGALDRKWLMITTPTGTGYGNYAAAGTLEFLSKGDCANVVMQYAARPSPISLDRVSDGRSQVRMLVDAIKVRIDERPPAHRPKVVMFGESLGAWSSQDAFLGEGSQGLIDAGIDHAIWIGTPMESKWKDQVLGPERTETDRTTIGVFNDISEWEALDQSDREQIRYVMITHYNDGVAVFGPALAVQAPGWLADPDQRPPTVPKSQRWIPVTSFVQGLIDNKNAARVVPGVFAAEGHDYRADLVPFFNSVLGFGASEQLQRAIVKALETEESRRTRWITERGKVGESMAAVILDKIRSTDPEAFAAAVAAVERDFVDEDLRDPTARSDESVVG
ncbi:MAG: alpha/beta hydrolase, partial [Acidimicrobiia bacterium]|nr:alpha/beta hydrolase [Acidimicrobiia bacterium]